jgi:hypothetical protein
MALAHAYSAVGKKAEADKILRDLERKSKETSIISPYTMGTIYAGLGENDKAFEFPEKAYSEKSLDLSVSLNLTWCLIDCVQIPVSKALCAGLGLNT